jgi:6-phosphogluconolactonase
MLKHYPRPLGDFEICIQAHKKDRGELVKVKFCWQTLFWFESLAIEYSAHRLKSNQSIYLVSTIVMTQLVHVYPDRSALVAAALALVLERIQTAIAGHQSCSIALSGGSTPQPLYAALAQQNLPWDKIQIFWGDERYVPYSHPDSNYGMTKRLWLDLVPIPAANIHPMPTDLASPDLAAAEYDRHIAAHFGLEAGVMPSFDITLLGMGDDGHTASLFPHTAALSVVDRSVTVGDKDGEPRLTLTIGAIDNSRTTIFLVCGASKQTALRAVFAPTGDGLAYPSRQIQPDGELLWLLDNAARSGIVEIEQYLAK